VGAVFPGAVSQQLKRQKITSESNWEQVAKELNPELGVEFRRVLRYWLDKNEEGMRNLLWNRSLFLTLADLIDPEIFLNYPLEAMCFVRVGVGNHNWGIFREARTSLLQVYPNATLVDYMGKIDQMYMKGLRQYAPNIADWCIDLLVDPYFAEEQIDRPSPERVSQPKSWSSRGFFLTGH
jgi:hypothetical protein